jgi:hypothetical protein
MTLLRVLIPCPACKDRDDSQPNFCRKCGGSGVLSRIVTPLQLAFMADIPEVQGASVVITARKSRRGR